MFPFVLLFRKEVFPVLPELREPLLYEDEPLLLKEETPLVPFD